MILKGNIGIPRPDRFNAPWEFVEGLLALDIPIISEGGSLIDANRNKLVFRSKDLDFLLMIDTDMVFNKHQVERIISHIENGKDIVSGFCMRNTEPPMPAVFTESQGDYQQALAWTAGLQKVDAVGGAFLCLSKKAMQTIENPFDCIKVNGFSQGEDISFCHKARKLGFDVWVDESIRVGHIRHTVLY